MKKCSFVKFIRKYENNEFLYEVVKNQKPHDSFTELMNSLTEFTKIEVVDFEYLGTDTSLIVSFDVVDITSLFKEQLHNFLKTIQFKKLILKANNHLKNIVIFSIYYVILLS